MLVIKDIEVLNITDERGLIKAIRHFYPERRQWEIERMSDKQTYVEETIEGKKFVNARGEKVCIGITKQAEEALGLPFEIFEKKRLENEQLKKENYSLTEKVYGYKNMRFWDRVKFLIRGKIK